MNVSSVEPFLRWAGGKKWLVKHLNDIIGDLQYNTYFEPFLGGGSMFFSLNPKRGSLLSDCNKELIDTYIAVKNDPQAIIDVLKRFTNTESFYYFIRAQHFANRNEAAARFIYLNQTSFNGLYRVNKKGEYNVPYGFRTKAFLEQEKLFWASECLQSATLSFGDFDICKNEVREGDLVFLDPPYTVSHNDNGFIKYNQVLFSLEDQIRLSKFIDSIKIKGAYYVLTNAAHEKIKEIFTKDDDLLLTLSRASLIGGAKAKRGQIREYIFTNIRRSCR